MSNTHKIMGTKYYQLSSSWMVGSLTKLFNPSAINKLLVIDHKHQHVNPKFFLKNKTSKSRVWLIHKNICKLTTEIEKQLN